MALTLVRSRTRRSRREEEAAMRKVPFRPPTEEALREELDQGIAQLPSRLREAVILCHLEGHKQADAARILGCNQGTLSRWATDGLEQLRSLLAHRGVIVTSAALIGFFSQQQAMAAVPAGLFGSLAAAGAGKVALVAKAKLAVVVVLIAMVIGAGTVAVLQPSAVEPKLIFQCGKGRQGSKMGTEQVEFAAPVTTASCSKAEAPSPPLMKGGGIAGKTELRCAWN